jgi:hypothetical protein
MQLWTFNELILITREELGELTAKLEHELKKHGPGTSVRSGLLASLRNIRRVMLLRLTTAGSFRLNFRSSPFRNLWEGFVIDT